MPANQGHDPATTVPTPAPSPGATTTTLRAMARDAVEAAWHRATASGALPPLPEGTALDVAIERPANVEHGDLATSLALRLARTSL